MTTESDATASDRVFVVGWDFSPCSESALSLAIRDLLPTGGTLRIVHALEPTVTVGGFDLSGARPASDSPAELAAEVRSKVNEELETRLAGIRREFPQLHFEGLVVSGAPDTVLLDQAQARGVERVVVGTHGRRGLTHLLLGSVAERVVRLAPCTVVVAKPAEGGELSYPDEG